MSFDQNSTLPVVNVHKKTTQVNIGVIVAVLVFFIVSGIAFVWFSRHKAETVNEVHEKQTQEGEKKQAQEGEKSP